MSVATSHLVARWYLHQEVSLTVLRFWRQDADDSLKQKCRVSGEDENVFALFVISDFMLCRSATR